MLTSAGKTFLAIGAISFVVGALLDYRTLVALGIAFLVAVAIGRLWIVRRPRVEASRVVVPERVRAGRPARTHLTITNGGRRRTSGGIAYETFGADQIPVELPGLEPGDSAVVTTELPTELRGVFRVGPLDVTRGDPFGLVRSGEPEEGVARLWVHPVVHTLDPFPSGLARDLDGPESGEALEGGITFHTLREYVRGDDLRLIHWRSSARSNKLMVRHNVDTNHPRSLIVLDTRASSYTAESFEDAVRAAASIVVASLNRGFEFRLLTTDGLELDQRMPAASIMDRLAEIGLSFRGSVDAVFDEVIGDLGGVSLALLTGTSRIDELDSLTRLKDRFDVITIAQFAAADDEGRPDRGIPDAILLKVSSSQEFARAWNKATRR
ncbi:MAG: DUF58 domain-containing protein [Acidimicrobiales bacterium]